MSARTEKNKRKAWKKSIRKYAKSDFDKLLADFKIITKRLYWFRLGWTISTVLNLLAIAFIALIFLEVI